MQLGFVIDHSRCIGCHACTVACKSENDVPLGSFRTWVKYTERGTFPEVRRSFAVLRCNQCTSAPCITICPTVALDKMANGIVDIDPERCIGCKSCMQACPYDALHIHEDKGIAQKCHFCAHRTERGLAPACAIVCPTEAIIPGDFNDPQSVVSQMRASGELTARKTEAGTGPNVWYRDVAPAGVDPAQTNASGGSIWADTVPGLQASAEEWEAMEARAQPDHDSARTVYDVHHPAMWGWKVSAYLFTKSLAAGAFLVLLLFAVQGGVATAAAMEGLGPLDFGIAGGLFFLAVTTVLLVADLKRPERFLYILLKPNWSSWLTRGALVLMAYGGLLTLWLALRLGLFRVAEPVATIVFGVTIVAGALTAMYTAWLFAQAKGRALWMRKGLATHLLVQAWVAGCALLLLSYPLFPWTREHLTIVRVALAIGLFAHTAFIVLEHRLAPVGREAEYERAAALLSRGPFARRRQVWTGGVGIGAPLIGLLLTTSPITWMLIGAMVLVGLWNEEDTFVRAGQALPIS
ncbi:MAG: polysulfide reductase NrfD [Planctomycetota bacterium]|nr:polysulfide reductase NrfD [Planctomycetota bacterium]